MQRDRTNYDHKPQNHLTLDTGLGSRIQAWCNLLVPGPMLHHPSLSKGSSAIDCSNKVSEPKRLPS